MNRYMYSQKRIIKVARIHKDANTLQLFLQILNAVIENKEVINAVSLGLKSALTFPKYYQKILSLVTKCVSLSKKAKDKIDLLKKEIKKAMGKEERIVIDLRKKKKSEDAATDIIKWLESFVEIVERTTAAG